MTFSKEFSTLQQCSYYPVESLSNNKFGILRNVNIWSNLHCRRVYEHLIL